MDEEMHDSYVEYTFTAVEIDLDYEYDAVRFFDFTREESLAEALQAELWFDAAETYPPTHCNRSYKASLCEEGISKPKLTRFIEKYGTHVIVGVKMGGKDVVYVNQQYLSSLQPADVLKKLKDVADKRFSDSRDPVGTHPDNMTHHYSVLLHLVVQQILRQMIYRYIVPLQG